MKINGNEIRPGNVIEHKGGLWAAVKIQHVKPGKGPAYAQVELKNLIDGTKLNERFRSSETVERVRWSRTITSISMKKATCSSSWIWRHTTSLSWPRSSWASARRSCKRACK